METIENFFTQKAALSNICFIPIVVNTRGIIDTWYLKHVVKTWWLQAVKTRNIYRVQGLSSLLQGPHTRSSFLLEGVELRNLEQWSQ